jgi:hypothetical protein
MPTQKHPDSREERPTKPAVGIKELAAELGTDPRELRAFLRGLDLGAGRGKRYAWPSMTDPTVKRIVREWQDAQKPAEAPDKAS